MKLLRLPFAAAVLATTAHAQFGVRTVDGPGGGNISNINLAESILASEPTVGSGQFSVINFVGGGTDADFPGGVAFPGGLGNTDNFAMEAIGLIAFNTPGTYVFQVNSDDGFRLRRGVNFDGTGGTVYSEFVTPRGPFDTNGPGITIPPATVGYEIFRLTYFELNAGEEIEFSYSLNGGPQQLVGSTADLTVQPIPEPGALALIGIGLAGFARRRRGISALVPKLSLGTPMWAKFHFARRGCPQARKSPPAEHPGCD